MTTPIPQPKTIPFLGNAKDIDSEVPLRSFSLLARQYGEIYHLRFPGLEMNVLNSYRLANEVSDETRFEKRVQGALEQVRELVGDGLFTAHYDSHKKEPNWAVAHRVLMPAFGPANIRGMFEDMRDICTQLIQKWTRFGPTANFEASEDFTRLALDTLFLCSMNHRLNSFYSNDPPPFAAAMGDFLTEAGSRSRRPGIVSAMMTGTTAKWFQDKDFMVGLAAKVVAERQATPDVKYGDLLDTMLYSKDPKTGQGLPPDNISRNLVTFMIAGHETTSGTLSFMVYFVLKHPEAMQKLRAEVDSVVGKRPIAYEDLPNLVYLHAVMRETLRLFPPVSVRSAVPIQDTTIGDGKYALKGGMSTIINTYSMQRDPLVWGDDAEEFKPERMLDGKFEALPKNAWQPFGFGARACIGRPFAWQEMQIAMVTILQTFELSLADPSYDLQLKQTLTVKPSHLYIHARLRTDAPTITPSPSAPLKTATSTSQAPQASKGKESLDGKHPIYILYGSNTGTCEGFAQTIANDAPRNGFKPILGTLDSAAGALPTDGPVIIVSATFEGQPPDNAGAFVQFIESLPSDGAKDVKFAVFGCGNPDWVRTFQRIPSLFDAQLSEKGGTRLIERGVGDVVEGGFFQYFDEWEAKLWTVLNKEFSTDSAKVSEVGLGIEIISKGSRRAETLRQADIALGTVLENRVLTAPGAPVKRHLEIALPEGLTYRAGDYLTLLPRNHDQNIRRVLSRFSLQVDDEMVISSNGLATTLPVDRAIPIVEILGGYVELSQPATTRDLAALMDAATSDNTKAYLQDLLDHYVDKVQAQRISVLTILESKKDIALTFPAYLSMLPSMRLRQYSISSSPLWNPSHVTLTISVLDAPSKAQEDERFLGVASNYLAGLKQGDKVHVGVRASSAAFHPPSDPAVPIVCFCAGSGLAPMRGFIQERAMQKESGRDVAPVVCFFGCRSPDEDYLYATEDLARWSELGILDIRPAFSRSSEASQGSKYVQDRVWADRNNIRELHLSGAKYYMCGSAKVAQGVRDRLIDIVAENSAESDASKVYEKIVAGRFATDIFD
ncbi:fatty acid hydroxylase [Flagelloscypha sp. PMI_526]|nr:fatty acid hydroxylase [Flagelloscypha sp. PMI_526]